MTTEAKIAAIDLFLASLSLQTEGRGWLTDCFPEQEEEIGELTPRGLAYVITKEYEGGLVEFIFNSKALV